MGAISGSGISIEEALPLDGGGTIVGPLTIDQDANALSLSIDSESTTVGVISIQGARVSSANVLDISDANQLTTGGVARFHSNGGLTNTRSLVDVVMQNTAGSGTTALRVSQSSVNQAMILDQNAASSFIDYQGTAAANSTDPISTLTTSGATTHHIQVEINGAKAWIAVSTNVPS